MWQAKALTISKLIEIAPVGTMDPTPFIYDSTMYTMAGLMVREGGHRIRALFVCTFSTIYSIKELVTVRKVCSPLPTLTSAVSSQGVAALGHSMVKPMDPKYFEKIDTYLS